MPHDFSFSKIHDAEHNTNTLIVVFSHYHYNMVFIKKALLSLYVLLIVVMATATIVEHCTNTPFVSEHIYGAWWFTLLWALLAADGITYIIKQHVKKWNILLLHLSLLIILSGALLTHLTSFSSSLLCSTPSPCTHKACRDWLARARTIYIF